MSQHGPLGVYARLIGYLQRSDLDQQGLRLLSSELDEALATAVDLNTPIPIGLYEVRGVSRLWDTAVSNREASGKGSPYLSGDILAGLNGQRIQLYFLIRGEARRIHIYVGTDFSAQPESGPTVRAMFRSQYPGLQWASENTSLPSKAANQELASIRSFLRSCEYVGIVTGVPTPSLVSGVNAGTQIDRLTRGLYGTEWAYLVLGEPAEDTTLRDLDLALLFEQIRVELEQGSREWQSGLGQPVAYYYHETLGTLREFLMKSFAEGGWWVQSYICSPDEATYYRAKGLLKSTLSGDFSKIDRIRVIDCPGAGPKVASFSPIVVKTTDAPSDSHIIGQINPFKYQTLVSSEQLSALVHMPRVEMPGYFIRDSSAFDVSSHLPEEYTSVEIGEILDRGHKTGNSYRIRIEDLTRHCLLVGITGAGKTNTAFHLLRQLQRQKIPFLIIEPAKREYRTLLRLAGAEASQLQVFTVGVEGKNAAPFRFNPFEIRPGVGVQSHIDLLKSVFNASFGMWAPLPQVLERAIHEVYRDKGWDTVYGTNDRAALRTDGQDVWHPRGYPTLTDLSLKISELVPTLGYDKEVERNVKTALETRINSLRIGAKGMVLDTPLSIPIEYLLESPTLLELEGIADDDEKAFLMGLILVALYEHYRYSVQDTASSPALTHLTVIEEAHRLLANAPVSIDPEAGNPRAKAVETFVSMLSEVRAYGEGFLIAEQIPTKLTPDVIKNTALKIMHRVVSNDDREAMGGTMNLDRQQLRQVVSLSIGEAVVHGGGYYSDDNAILIKVPAAKEKTHERSNGSEDGSDVRRAWEKFRDEHGLVTSFQSYPTCSANCVPLNPLCSNARRIAEDSELDRVFEGLVLSLVAGMINGNEREIDEFMAECYESVQRVLRALNARRSERPEETRCVLTHALYRFLDSYGARYGWKYVDAENLAHLLLPALLAIGANRPLSRNEKQGITAFCRQYSILCTRDFDPFYGCSEACPTGDDGQGRRCLYRYGVEKLTRHVDLESQFIEAQYEQNKLVSIVKTYADRIVDINTPVKELRSVALCLTIHGIRRDESLNSAERRNLINELIQAYDGTAIEQLPPNNM